MRIGTKSVLFGAHQFLIHPWFVAEAWRRLFGFPFDPRLWVAFFVHDLGYIGKPNMDGPEGEDHVRLGAMIMYWLFDWAPLFPPRRWNEQPFKWHDFSMYHSRFYAKKNNKPVSRLCIADKLAITLQPAWLYLPAVRATGEIKEYMKLCGSMNTTGNKYDSMKISTESEEAWYKDVQSYIRNWVEEHKDGREDTWTPKQKEAKSDTGVWK